MVASVSEGGLAALRRVRLNYTRDLRSIWADTDEHVPAVNGDVVSRLLADLAGQTGPGVLVKPMGWAVIGPAGAGKTHLLSTLRRQVWEAGGWFVLLDLLDVNDFWRTAALGFVDALGRQMGGRSQGQVLFDRLCARFGLPARLASRLDDPAPEAWTEVVHAFTSALRREDSHGALAHRDTARALLGLLCGNDDRQANARAWLLGAELEKPEKEALGLLTNPVPPIKAVEGLSWLMAMGGPTFCAMDQIDPIVSVAHLKSGTGPGDDPAVNRASAVINELAGGLMNLRDVTDRTVTLVSALEESWNVLRTRGVSSFKGRFQETGLRAIGSGVAAREMVRLRLATGYKLAGFVPPYPTWPFRPEAFDSVRLISPRELLQSCQAHINQCLDGGVVEELIKFPGGTDPGSRDTQHGQGDIIGEDLGKTGQDQRLGERTDRSPIEKRYAELCAAPPPPGLLDANGEDARVVDLLIAALESLVEQSTLLGTQDLIVEHDTPGLHARLRLIDNAAGGRERHHCFRAIAHTDANATRSRLQAAITASGIDRDLPFRHLIILRRSAWPGGPKTKTAELVRDFERRGGRVLAPDAKDFSRFAALQTLLAEAPAGLDAWLRDRRPLADSPFFRSLGLVDEPAEEATKPPPPPEPAMIVDPPPPKKPATSIPLGMRVGDHAPVLLPLGMLPRHMAVIAASGSGKTVLLRRLIEEAALAGIPAIVLDSNNDLVRLGEPWPERPPGFTDQDAVKAAEFLRRVEVIVWTPGRPRGNPLALAPLPDFAAVRDDPEELGMAVNMAAEALEKLIAAGGGRRQLRKGVLVDALRHFARAGGGRLTDLVALLRDLPAEASEISGAPRLAPEIADALLAAMSINPLLQGAGTPLDPAVLLGGGADRVRISVVNLAGLPGEEARQDFVSRLLMALFGHIRRYPATADHPVRGLLVMDEAQNFAPSDRGTPSRSATVGLVRQARKYGLGMVFATQAPKAIDNNVIGSCTTQVFGLTNSPAALDAVREMLRSRGGGGDDLGRLPRGEFYLTTEGSDRPQKLKAPLCLTHHPQSPPSEDEVVERAARTRLLVQAASR